MRYRFKRWRGLSLTLATLLLCVVCAHAQPPAQLRTGIFNGYLAQSNIVECVNTGNEPRSATLSLYSAFGALVRRTPFDIRSRETKHFILDEFDIKNSFGTYQIEGVSNEDLHCLTVFYRGMETSAHVHGPDALARGYVEYAYALALQEPIRGTSTGILNTFNPQQNSSPTLNWLTVINPGIHPVGVRIEIYDQNGMLDSSEHLTAVQLQAHERRDIQLRRGKSEAVGLYRIIPEDPEREYGAVLTRYAPLNGGFSYAFAAPASRGSCALAPLAVSTGAGGVSWAEIANPTELTVYALAQVTDAEGRIAAETEFALEPHAQRHLLLNEMLGENALGTLKLICPGDQPQAKLVVQAATYGSNNHGNIEWGYLTAARQTPPQVPANLTAPVNTYLRAKNWALIFEDGVKNAAVQLSGFTQQGEHRPVKTRALPQSGTVNFSLEELFTSNSVGSIAFNTDSASAAELLRMFPAPDGGTGAVMVVPAQDDDPPDAQGGAAGSGGTLLDVTSLSSRTPGQDNSQLARGSRMITTTVPITVRNTSSTEIASPLHLVIDLSAGNVSVQNALGGNGTGPYVTYYQDLSSSLSGGTFSPGETINTTLVFVRPRSTQFTYSLRLFGGEENAVPTADAGADQSFTVAEASETVVVTLDGTASGDADGTVNSYSWSGTPNPADVASPTITLGVGEHTFDLVVTDNDGAQSSTASVTVNIMTLPDPSPQHAPLLSVTPENLTVNEGETATINVSGSDPDGHNVALSARPDISNAGFTGGTSGANPSGTFTFNTGVGQRGRYVVSFTARDELGVTTEKDAVITVVAVNHAPALVVPGAQMVDEGQALTLALSTSDPDDDSVEVEASSLPANAIFVPATNSLTFTPDYSQAGTYEIQFSATDGLVSTAPQTLPITVNDVPAGDPGTPRELILQVDELESPTLLSTLPVTGTAQRTNNPPAARRGATSSLITGVSPSTATQGQTLTVTVNGTAGGSYQTHFIIGETTADFGEGITVNSVNVTDGVTATVSVTVSADAEPGTRQIALRTGQEIAVSLIGFQVMQGQATVTGRLIDPDTGLPIAGAYVSIQGSATTAVSAADGTFSLAGCPAGEQTLLINAPNHEFLTTKVDVAVGNIINLGDLSTTSTVFDPSAPAAATLRSILGRGFTELFAGRDIEEAKKLFADAIIAVGGTDLGVLDEYGNQLNPAITGTGVVSATPEHVQQVADAMTTGETRSLLEYLFSFSFGFEWAGDHPPTLTAFVSFFQEVVNQAWASPSAEESQVVIAIFNPRNNFVAEPPTISADTQLNAAQGYLLMTTWLAYTIGTQKELAAEAQVAGAASARASSSKSLGSPEANPPTGPQTYYGRASWALRRSRAALRDAGYDFAGNLQSGYPAETFKAAAWNTITATAYRPSNLPGILNPGDAAQNFLEGEIKNLLIQPLIAALLETTRPRAPLVLAAYQETLSVPAVDGTTKLTPGPVIVRFKPTFRDNGPRLSYVNGTPVSREGNPEGMLFLYRLWRLTRSDDNTDVELKLISQGEPRDANDADWSAGRGPRFVSSANEYQFVDPTAKPGHQLYYIDVVRWVGSNPGEALPDTSWTSWIPGNGIPIVKGGIKINPVGEFTTALDPMIAIAKGIREQTSPLSQAVPIWVKEDPLPNLDPVDGMVVDGLRNLVYVTIGADGSIPGDRGKIEVYDAKDLTLLGEIDAGFKAPGPKGLAMNLMGEIFSDNSASDATYGGRVFRYQPYRAAASPAARDFVGSVNYFSLDLMYARPTAVAALAMAFDQQVIAADAYEQRLKKIPVNAAWEPTRRVGQPFAESEVFDFTNLNDMNARFDSSVWLAQGNDVIQVFPGPIVHKLFGSSPSPLRTAMGLDFDTVGNLYVSEFGASAAEGAVFAFPPTEQAAFQSRTPSACELERLKIFRYISRIGPVRVAPDGKSLYYRSRSKTEMLPFGISGRIVDDAGQPLVGAAVRAEEMLIGKYGPVRTDACGVYHLPGVRTPRKGAGGTVRITVAHQDKGAQSYIRYLEAIGPTFADLVLDPPTPEPDAPQLPPNVPVAPVASGPLPGFVTINVPLPTLPGTPPPSPEPVPPRPLITLTSPVDGVQTSAAAQTIVGYVSDDRLASVTVWINGAGTTAAVAAKRFELATTLHSGWNRIVASGTVNDPTAGLLTVVSPEVQVFVGAGPYTRSYLSGRVVDPNDGLPLAGARVRVQETGDETYTDAQGFFFFDNLPSAGVTVELVEPVSGDEGVS